MIDAQIKYTKARSLSEVLNTAFNYLRLNIKSISTLLLYYVSPFFVLSILASYYFNTSQVSLSNFIAYVSTMFNDNVVEFTVTIAFYFIGLAMQNHLINKHLILNEDLNSDEQVNEKQFRSRLVEDFLQYFSNVFFLALTVILIALLLDAAIGNFLVVNFTYTFSEDPISFIFEALPLLIYLAFVMPLSCYFIVTCLFFAQRNKTGYVEALKKSMVLYKRQLVYDLGNNSNCVYVGIRYGFIADVSLSGNWFCEYKFKCKSFCFYEICYYVFEFICNSNISSRLHFSSYQS